MATCVGDAWIEAGAPDGKASSVDIVRIKAEDLREAQRTASRIRADARASDRDVAVFLDVESHTAVDARTAWSELDSFCSDEPTSVRYVGTEAGLLGLISDITAAGVADGVTILRLGRSEDAMKGTG
ncbi:hypothetical protein CIW52_11475 [Mycolicibacterium sp. P9-64]|uniref:hypothetical protein n=1 Tax=Mycolicibacterium sp. P9-64 TaxID=2024612 RepID=UPI0011EFB148|nr:hypothetical protein [Mycolicibacterium sp. P9-64]KAA0084603.1 hypothetical protein CIW52_11475 [Mycolicibacterium sp. P9-64]